MGDRARVADRAGGEWRSVRLGEMIELKRGYDLPQSQREPGAVPVVSSSGPSGFHSASMAKAPGVVTGRYGTLGKVFFVTQDFWPLNTTLYVRDFKGNDPKFVSYLLRTIDFLSCSDKAAVPGVNRNHLHELQVSVPPLSEQRAIANILGTLDDKIELNRRMNETLEAMARALFKSWFVDFDPVRAKAEGRTPSGMDAETAKLFPSEFVVSELGPIPKGWRALAIYDLGIYTNGAAYKAFQPNGERLGLPIIKIAELKAGVTSQTKFSEVQMPEKYRLRTGDILFSWSGNPDTSIDTFVWGHGAAWLNQHIFRVEPRDSFGRSFVLATLKFLRPTFAEIARNKQTTGLGHVTVGDMQRLSVVVPDDQVLAAWERHVAALFDAILSASWKT